jgi:hypothetical protein
LTRGFSARVSHGVDFDFSGPMAFTVDFGSTHDVDSEAKKKLSLRDGIR